MLGVPSGEAGGAPGLGADIAESGWWVGRNGLATTHLDSALISASALSYRQYEMLRHAM